MGVMWQIRAADLCLYRKWRALPTELKWVLSTNEQTDAGMVTSAVLETSENGTTITFLFFVLILVLTRHQMRLFSIDTHITMIGLYSLEGENLRF